MRRLKADPVSDEVLIDLIDAANQAASGSNAQMARWIVVKDPAQKRKLADLNRLHGEPYIAADRENPRDDKQRRLLDAVIWQMDHMHEIPALIVACYDYGTRVDGLEIYRKAGSVWPGIQNLLLTARADGPWSDTDDFGSTRPRYGPGCARASGKFCSAVFASRWLSHGTLWACNAQAS